MTGQQLKASILQLAIQGKLVPQNPDDEPASLLLERIRKEKEKLIKEKKISADKNPSRIFRGVDGLFYEKIGKKAPILIQDEIPFDIPESWEWVRLGSIGYTRLGKTLNKEKDTGEIKPYLCSINVNWSGINLDKVKEALFEGDEQEAYRLKKGDILICEGGDVGRTAIWNQDREMYYQNALHRIRFIDDSMDVLFFKTIMESYKAIGLIDAKSKGVTIKHFVQSSLTALLFPFPPLEEQKRIANKLNEVLPLVDKYGEVEKELSDFNASFPKEMKKSILQYAIQGKLVPQNPDDEPASVLLERIRQEKKKLVKSGAIKKDKHESVIYKRDGSYFEKVDGKERCIDDEIPFDIPESWEWARLGVISTYGCTKQKVKASDVNPSVWGLDLEDIEKGGKILERKTVGERSSKGDKTVFKKGDILYSKLRPYLLKILVALDDGVCSSEIVPFHVYGEIVADYIVTYLKSPYVDNLINGTTYGVKMPRVGTETMTALLVPIPPLSEQKRIVAKLEDILPYLSFEDKTVVK